MAFDDTDRPTPASDRHQLGQDLSTLSIDELKNRIQLLDEEILRLRDAIARKEKTKAAADSIFRT